MIDLLRLYSAIPVRSNMTLVENKINRCLMQLIYGWMQGVLYRLKKYF